MGVFLSVLAQQGFAQDSTAEQPVTVPLSATTESEQLQQLKSEAVKDIQKEEISESSEQLSIPQPGGVDSVAMLQQQESFGQNLPDFQPISFEDLEDLPVAPVDQSMADEIFRVASDAKQQAEHYRAGQTQEITVQDANAQELTEINRAPVDVDVLMSSIQADSRIVVEANEQGRSLPELGTGTVAEETAKPGLLKRWFYKIRPPREPSIAKVSRIKADVIFATEAKPEGTDLSAQAYATALESLKSNIQGKLSAFTQESFSDFSSALPQLRNLSIQAAQAVGFYNAVFRFEKLSDAKVKVSVVPNAPVVVEKQNIEFSGAGEKQPQFQVIRVLPDLDTGDILHHGKYEQTKSRINEAASNNGFFDSFWRLHDVKVSEPQNTADINLRFETGTRYKLGPVEFRMSDPSKEIPIDHDVLESMVSWKDGADYAFWRVNSLANNLTNSRYFNYTLVDAVRPDPVVQVRELPPDLQALMDEGKLNMADIQPDAKVSRVMAPVEESRQQKVDEQQFAGAQASGQENENLRRLKTEQQDKQNEEDRLKEQARDEKKVPVIVTLNADKLNSAEVGLGYGTDTGVRLRGQYRRAIVNKRGHSFDANMELSEIRQSIDGRYNIPYNHPLNDYISLVGGYEREERDDVGQGVNLMIESAVAGADRIIKNPRGSWQHTFGVRYRLDRLTQRGAVINPDEIPDAFLANRNNEQESFLLGYEISRTDSDKRVNPTKGFKQTYKVELGSEKLLSDADMAIVNAEWKFIYSLGENDNHQFIGRGNLGYIFTDDFNKVPYNLRYFSGGDQSMRGFDYKSLSPEVDGFKVGGQALGVGSLEYNYQFKEGWRAALFSDYGNAYDKDFSNPSEYSVGVGVRWASPIGPIRIDVASGISDENHPVRLHFFIGSQL